MGSGFIGAGLEERLRVKKYEYKRKEDLYGGYRSEDIIELFKMRERK